MRIHIQLSRNKEIVPFNYHAHLVACFHRWLGKNNWHDILSLYSLSWLSSTNRLVAEHGFNYPDGCNFFVSTPNIELAQGLIKGINKSPEFRWGMCVNKITLQNPPSFKDKEQRFRVRTPVLIKRKSSLNEHYQYYYPADHKANDYLTETLNRKLRKAEIKGKATVKFDNNYSKVKIRKINYKGIHIKAAICPIIIKGPPEVIGFAWDVGVGNSTGIGFGALL